MPVHSGLVVTAPGISVNGSNTEIRTFAIDPTLGGGRSVRLIRAKLSMVTGNMSFGLGFASAGASPAGAMPFGFQTHDFLPVFSNFGQKSYLQDWTAAAGIAAPTVYLRRGALEAGMKATWDFGLAPIHVKVGNLLTMWCISSASTPRLRYVLEWEG